MITDLAIQHPKNTFMSKLQLLLSKDGNFQLSPKAVSCCMPPKSVIFGYPLFSHNCTRAISRADTTKPAPARRGDKGELICIEP